MQIVNVRFQVQPGKGDDFAAAFAPLAAATRDEPGNLWYVLSRNTENPDEYYALEGYTDEGLNAHFGSAHFQQGGAALAPFLAAGPEVIARQVEGDGWSPLGL
ncbi:MAG: putative quinol monooxygenase [Gordonia sp. (in: high G+C Gram-positive bacteria)]|uniref:putative quinol monooxygenase n=1 Tax=Gordonia sp. (in: high G+C Gram-positive bacteria) TaxID=84139 RepID=UPI003BB7577E